ncbi:hypothetical protein D3C87_1785690 [compost metagenome]
MGLEISFSNPKCFKNPSVNFVFPAPKSPLKTITELLLNFDAIFSEKDFVSSSE